MFVAQVGKSREAGGDLGLEVVMYDTSQEDDMMLQEEMMNLGIAGHVYSYFLINLCIDSLDIVLSVLRIYNFCILGTGFSVSCVFG